MSEITEVSEGKPVKLPYFHRKLSDQETALIGDITPKQIQAQPESKLISGSVWNTANTWEERDCSTWATTHLPTLFGAVSFTSGAYAVTLEEASGASGNAQIAHIRGTARFIYELALDLKFTVAPSPAPSSSSSLSSPSFAGTLSISDLISDQLDDTCLEIKWTKSPPGAESKAVRGAVMGAELRGVLARRMGQFEQDFRLM